MKLRAVVSGALVIAATVAVPAAAEAGIHVSPGATDSDGCYAIDVWNGDVLVRTIPAWHASYDSRYCATLARTAFLPSGILLFGVGYDDGFAPETDVWASDGTTDGTVELGGYGTDGCYGAWRIVGRSAYISVTCGDGYVWIVATRGTPASTWVLPRSGGVTLPGYVVRHGRIFFSATHPTKGRELWVCNGTRRGTHVVKDIRPGPRGSYPRRLSSDGTRLRFTADDGTGRRWWVSNGTRRGTYPE